MVVSQAIVQKDRFPLYDVGRVDRDEGVPHFAAYRITSSMNASLCYVMFLFLLLFLCFVLWRIELLCQGCTLHACPRRNEIEEFQPGLGSLGVVITNAVL